MKLIDRLSIQRLLSIILGFILSMAKILKQKDSNSGDKKRWTRLKNLLKKKNKA